MKLSKTAIRELTKMYRAVLMGALLVSLFGTAESNATPYFVASESGGANTTQINIGTAASKAIGDFDPANAASNAKTAIENKLTTSGGSTGYDIDAKSISTNLGNGPQGGPTYGTADLGGTTVKSISTYQYTGSLDENGDPIMEHGSAELGDTSVYGTLQIGEANAIRGKDSEETGKFLDMGGNAVKNVQGLTLTNGKTGENLKQAQLTVTDSGVVSTNSHGITTARSDNTNYGAADLGTVTVHNGDGIKVIGSDGSTGSQENAHMTADGKVWGRTSLGTNGSLSVGLKTEATETAPETYHFQVNGTNGNVMTDGTLKAGATTVSSISTSNGAADPNYGTANLGQLTIHGRDSSNDATQTTFISHKNWVEVDTGLHTDGNLSSEGNLRVGLIDSTEESLDDNYHFVVAANTGNIRTDGTVTAEGLVTANSGLTVKDGQNLTLGGNAVNAIDAGSSAITSGSDTTLATTATVLKSAENATYTATGPNLQSGTTRTISTAIDTLDEKMGKVAELGTYSGAKGNLTNGGTTPPTTVVQALENIDQSMGKIHGLANANGTVNNTNSTVGNGTNLAKGTTVEDHLVSLDNAIGNRTITSANGTINAATATSLSAGLQAAGDQIGSLNYSTTHYVRQGANITDAISALDSNLDRVENKVEKMNKQMKSGFASMAALNGLKPNARACNDTQIAIGAGNYRGVTGFALGGFHYVNDNLMLNIGAGYAGNQSTTVSGGLTFGW